MFPTKDSVTHLAVEVDLIFKTVLKYDDEGENHSDESS